MEGAYGVDVAQEAGVGSWFIVGRSIILYLTFQTAKIFSVTFISMGPKLLSIRDTTREMTVISDIRIEGSLFYDTLYGALHNKCDLSPF
jgi:hypothetical protein